MGRRGELASGRSRNCIRNSSCWDVFAAWAEFLAAALRCPQASLIVRCPWGMFADPLPATLLLWAKHLARISAARDLLTILVVSWRHCAPEPSL